MTDESQFRVFRYPLAVEPGHRLIRRHRPFRCKSQLAGSQESGSWGPRPTLLQALFEGGLRTLPSKERYRELRQCYARDRGASTAREITELFERGAKEVGSVTVEV